ncbi:NADH-ubiquinone oxidoreductase subunit, mitochondrial [Wickerhamiella sorbophila]|uniref:NADH-ubiquinone oxidoreductase subunit, mitochondrial n=1 Tax=Wickerhamiella sorbophila TaxID=45607 RepID=A0A2T0FEP1_9ASCO|nr:NADH-ubiquinone oxidoreductase subunit, mitochondrial [Wickerhamiella sorbophila]PRT53445.1 NADH-ubiquinone oxidoreductase subunit, mitochondrial [Wickerhamiella sorbophila]
MLRVKSVVSRPALARGLQTFEALDSQVNVLRNGKTVVSQGTGGRSSRSGYTVTVFGAAGNVGTMLVSKLARHGTLTVVPYREEMFKRHLKPAGDLGVVNFQEFDLRNIQSIADSVKSSDVVVNLVGRSWETKNFSFYDVHVEGARRIAQAAKDAGVPRFVHVSSHSADINSHSKFLATKAEGEEVVRSIIPDATIVRPGPVYGGTDRLLQPMATRKFFLTANNGQEVIYPTHLLDLATALEKIVYDDATAGQLFELYGNESFTMREIHDQVKDGVKKDLHFVNLPKKVLKLIAEFFQVAAYWQGPLTPDEVERMFVNQVISKDAKTYADLGITPQKLADHLLFMVRWHRPNTYLHDSVESDRRRKKTSEDFANIVD